MTGLFRLLPLFCPDELIVGEKRESMMRLALIAAVTVFGACAHGPASADHWDVITLDVKEDCTLTKYFEIIGDFNDWAEPHGYQAKVAIPLHNDDMETLVWIGVSEDAATFGAATDEWFSALGDPSSTPYKLNTRLGACTEIQTRSSFIVE